MPGAVKQAHLVKNSNRNGDCMFTQQRKSFTTFVLVATLVASPLLVSTETQGAARGLVRNAAVMPRFEYGFSLVDSFDKIVDLIADNPWKSGVVMTGAAALIVYLACRPVRKKVNTGFGYVGTGLKGTWNGITSACHWMRVQYQMSGIHKFSDDERKALLHELHEEGVGTVAFQKAQTLKELNQATQAVERARERLTKLRSEERLGAGSAKEAVVVAQPSLEQLKDEVSEKRGKAEAENRVVSGSTSSASSSSASSLNSGATRVESREAVDTELLDCKTIAQCVELLKRRVEDKKAKETTYKNLEAQYKEMLNLFFNDGDKKFGVAGDLAKLRDTLNVQIDAALDEWLKSTSGTESNTAKYDLYVKLMKERDEVKGKLAARAEFEEKERGETVPAATSMTSSAAKKPATTDTPTPSTSALGSGSAASSTSAVTETPSVPVGTSGTAAPVAAAAVVSASLATGSSSSNDACVTASAGASSSSSN